MPRFGLWIPALVAAGILFGGWCVFGAGPASSSRGGHVGLDLTQSPPRVDPHFLLDLVLRRLAPLPPGHPFRGRRIQILDLRGTEAYQDARIPTALPVDPDQLDTEAVARNLADLGTALVLYGDRDGLLGRVLARRSQEVFLVAPGWEAVMDRIERPQVATRPAADPKDLAMRREMREARDSSPEAPLISAARVKAMLDAGEPVTVLYVGAEETFRDRRIPGAIQVSFPLVDARLAELDPNRTVIFYCGCCEGASEGVSGFAARKALLRGFKQVWNLEGHLKGWVEAGYPTHRGP